jgi:DNA-binding transcriptional ArsR family regulator
MLESEVIDTLFRVLADPTRRRILDVLADRGEMTVSQLSAEFPHLVTSGISKHLMGLRAAGLVHSTRQGRQQLYRVEANAVTTVLAPWLARYERYWAAALERLRALAESGEHQTNPSHPPRDRRQVARIKSTRSRVKGEPHQASGGRRRS